MKHYMVYDLRAEYDEDEAVVMDCIGETTRKKAVAEFKREWEGIGILFEYDNDGENLINGLRVFV